MTIDVMSELRSYIVKLFLVSIFPVVVFSQEIAFNGDPDASFQRARTLAFDGHRSEARDTLNLILSAYPDYTDVRNLLAKTYSWDGNYEEARRQFNKITSEERDNKEVWVATVKNEVYAENYGIALGLANKALLYIKEDPDLIKLSQDIEEKIEEVHTDSKSLTNKMQFVGEQPYKNTIGIFSSTDVFDVVFDPMYYSGVEYMYESSLGKIIPRINYSNRFEIDAIQYELDLYPKFSKMFYGYLNYGYSKAKTYPNHRAGAELYANLPKGIEASLGMRYLTFSDSNVSIYTGSVGMYKGNYYFSLRPYITPRAQSTMGISGVLTSRRYLKDKYNYLGLNVGIGFMPEFRQFLANTRLIAETILFVEAQQALVEYQFSFKNNPSLYKVHFGLTRQELVFAAGNYYWAVSAGLRYQVRL